MAIVKQSFISNLIGKDVYLDFKEYAKIVIAIGTCILLILFLLTKFFYWEFLSSLLNIFCGSSILFIAYIAALIVLLDIEVDIEEPEYDYWSKKQKRPKPISYKLTIAWGIILALLGIGAIHFSNNYCNHYAFECSTILVDSEAKIYHLDYNICEDAKTGSNLKRLKGHQIDDSYRICIGCQEWAEDAKVEFEGNSSSNR